MLLAVLGWSTNAHAQQNLLDKPVAGPKRICLNYIAFDIKEGEQVVGFAAGVESAHLKVDGAGSSFEVGESQIYVQPRVRGKAIWQANGVTIFQQKSGKNRTYHLSGPADFMNGEERYLANISGEAVTGNATDAGIYRRFGMVGDSAAKCDHRFVYGWDYMFTDQEESAAQ